MLGQQTESNVGRRRSSVVVRKLDITVKKLRRSEALGKSFNFGLLETHLRLLADWTR